MGEGLADGRIVENIMLPKLWNKLIQVWPVDEKFAEGARKEARV
jgi:hypothetical protein